MSTLSSLAITPPMLFDSLEYSLVSLRKGINELYEGDATEVKKLSVLLRDLTCTSSGLEGLLWRAKAIWPFDDFIDVPDFEKELQEKPQNESANYHVPLMDHGEWQLRGVYLQRLSLQDYFNNRIAARYRRKESKDLVELKPVDIIKAVGNKIGAHSADKVSETFAVLAAIKSGNTSALVRLIGSYAMLVAEVGERALNVATSQGLQRVKNSPALPKTSIAHINIAYDLRVPEANMSNVDKIRLNLSHGTAEEARKANPPFEFGQGGIPGILIDVYVSADVNTEVYVSGLSNGLRKFVFDYPSGGKSLTELDVSWNDEIIRAEFDGKTQEAFRA